MRRSGSVITGVALTTMLITGLTAPVPGVGLRTASADSAQDQALQGSVSDQYFRVDWNAQPDGHGKARITGYVYNNYPETADRVQLRIIAFDGSGQQIGSFVEPMLDTVPALDRTYFDVKVPAHAASYHVYVDGFSFVDGE